MRYHEIVPMCWPAGAVRACPFDGLGCTRGERCSINSRDEAVSYRAFVADRYGPDFVCRKRETARKRHTGVCIICTKLCIL